MQTKDAADDINAVLGQIFFAGQWKLGRCVPSVCTAEDVAQVRKGLFENLQGLRNFMEEVFNDQVGPWLMESIDVLALNCHTADEEVTTTEKPKSIFFSRFHSKHKTGG